MLNTNTITNTVNERNTHDNFVNFSIGNSLCVCKSGSVMRKIFSDDSYTAKQCKLIRWYVITKKHTVTEYLKKYAVLFNNHHAKKGV